MRKSVDVNGFLNTRVSFGFLFWLGGAIHIMNQPGMGFWDGVVWLYYVGRFVAIHYAQLS